MNQIERLSSYVLPDQCVVYQGQLHNELCLSNAMFEILWALHPDEYSTIMIHGKPVKVPRFDRAFGKDYAFSGQIAGAAPIPDILMPYLNWVRQNIESSANGIFVNWHDGSLGHYHGKHRDSVSGLIHGTPITTISFGETRTFRMRPFPDAKPAIDFQFRNDDVIMIPWDTNQRWYHEIPKSTRNRGRRLSVTIRSFV